MYRVLMRLWRRMLPRLRAMSIVIGLLVNVVSAFRLFDQ